MTTCAVDSLHTFRLADGGSPHHTVANRAGICHGQVSDTPAGPFTAISAGYTHNCALTPAGAASCWGSNSDGQVSLANFRSFLF